ncbi:cytochrome P450 [Streptomyces sp. NPDC007808]|uniref:cytochrome P450 n=1 Tax=Streptomyces sp. NPDC007808 TaxID=3364779 RepID=UPI003690EA61
MTSPTVPAHVRGLDPFHPDVLRDPHPVYASLRDAGPATYLPDRDLWLVPRYEEASAILRNYREFISGLGVGYTRVPDHGYRYPLVDTDPPDHTRIRRAVQGWFRRAEMAELRPGVHAVAEELVAAAVDAGEVDAVAALARPLPDLTIRLLTGIVPPSAETIAAWADAVGQLAAPDLEPRHAELAARSLEWLSTEGMEALPPHCMARALMETGGHDGGLEADGPERLMTLDSIWLAGIDSSSSLLGNAVHAFCRFPEEWDRVRSDPALIPNAVEELMRWDSPFRAFYRRTVAPAVIGDVHIPADADVCVMLGSANRDPRRFDRPDRFDVTRADAKAHLALGASVHLCLGAPVARLETVEFLTALAGRVRRFEAAGEPVRARSQTMRKFDTLPVRLVPA